MGGASVVATLETALIALRAVMNIGYTVLTFFASFFLSRKKMKALSWQGQIE